MEEGRNQKAICKNPSQWAGKTCRGISKQWHKCQSHERTGNHFKHTGKYCKAGKSHSLNKKTNDIDQSQRDIKDCVGNKKLSCLCNDNGFFRVDEQVNKILTIEASGIGIACIVAKHFHVPVVFAKKTQSINLEGEMYVAEVESFTHKCKNQVIVAKKFLSEEDHVLIIDDFLANGKALEGLAELVTKSGAELVGAGVVIEKGFQVGGDIIRSKGIHLESLAIVESMDEKTGEVVFRD